MVEGIGSAVGSFFSRGLGAIGNAIKEGVTAVGCMLTNLLIPSEADMMSLVARNKACEEVIEGGNFRVQCRISDLWRIIPRAMIEAHGLARAGPESSDLIVLKVDGRNVYYRCEFNIIDLGRFYESIDLVKIDVDGDGTIDRDDRWWSQLSNTNQIEFCEASSTREQQIWAKIMGVSAMKDWISVGMIILCMLGSYALVRKLLI